jgi:DNA-binding response OmpR family regulator
MGVGERTAAGASKRILLVEDHEDSAEMMIIFLESEGYTVRWVNNAADALSLFFSPAVADSAHRPDLILLDLTLPDIDGVEVGRRLRKVSNPPPIIIMSAKSAQAVASAAEAVEAAGYVRKPFAAEQLMLSIERALGRTGT